MAAPASGSVSYPDTGSILDDALNGTIGNYHMWFSVPSDTSRDPVVIDRCGPRKSKKGGKRSRKSKSKSAKRCRRNRVKAMRSRRAHRRYMMTV